MAHKGQFTPETSRAQKLRRNELAKAGKIKIGRPKGSLNLATIAKINSRETFITAGQKLAGKWLNDLDSASTNGDTRATLGALDRVGIIAVQKIEHEHKFSLLGLANERAQLANAPEVIDGNKDVRAIIVPPSVDDDE